MILGCRAGSRTFIGLSRHQNPDLRRASCWEPSSRLLTPCGYLKPRDCLLWTPRPKAVEESSFIGTKSARDSRPPSWPRLARTYWRAVMASRFGKQLREIRLKLGLTQGQMGQVLGNGYSRISEWECGYRTPKPLTQVAILMRLQKAVAAAKRKKPARRKRS